MYLRTAALVLLVSLALSSAAENNKASDVIEVQINSYTPQVYASGSCAMRKRMYQEQYYYGSAEDHPYEHHEHTEGYKGDHSKHFEHKHDGYGSEAAAQTKGKVSSEDQVDVKTASAPAETDAKATQDATVPAQLLSADSEPAAVEQTMYGKSLERVLHNTGTGSGFYIAQSGSGAPLSPGWNGLLEDGQPCLSDWACCSGKCSESTCCSIEKLSNTQACSNNINCCSNNCVAVNAATPTAMICCKAGGVSNGKVCKSSSDCCSNNCLTTGLPTLPDPICCPAGSKASGGSCTSNADCCGNDKGAFCNGIGATTQGTCCQGLAANGAACGLDTDCCSGTCAGNLCSAA